MAGAAGAQAHNTCSHVALSCSVIGCLLIPPHAACRRCWLVKLCHVHGAQATAIWQAGIFVLASCLGAMYLVALHCRPRPSALSVGTSTHDATLTRLAAMRSTCITCCAISNSLFCPQALRLALLDWVCHVVVSNGALVQSCLQTLVYSLLPPPGEPVLCCLAYEWRPARLQVDQLVRKWPCCCRPCRPSTCASGMACCCLLLLALLTHWYAVLRCPNPAAGPPLPDPNPGEAWQPAEGQTAIQDEVLAATEKVRAPGLQAHCADFREAGRLGYDEATQLFVEQWCRPLWRQTRSAATCCSTCSKLVAAAGVSCRPSKRLRLGRQDGRRAAQQ